jgi:hypothetical protein
MLIYTAMCTRMGEKAVHVRGTAQTRCLATVPQSPSIRIRLSQCSCVFCFHHSTLTGCSQLFIFQVLKKNLRFVGDSSLYLAALQTARP